MNPAFLRKPDLHDDYGRWTHSMLITGPTQYTVRNAANQILWTTTSTQTYNTAGGPAFVGNTWIAGPGTFLFETRVSR